MMLVRNLILNLFLSLLWPALQGEFRTSTLVYGYLIGFAVLALNEPEYGKRVLKSISFFLYVVVSILESNVRVAWLVLQPRPQLDPGIVAIPLETTNSLEITVLASIITLTPGTLSVDLREDSRGRKHLLVHNIKILDRERFRQEIKDRFERRLLAITRGDRPDATSPALQKEEPDK
jgi:multicomponent Na+:H+ antiporter subunit E